MNSLFRVLRFSLLIASQPLFAADMQNDVPFLLQFTHGATEAAGIGELSKANLTADQREVRIWLGFGIMRINRMLRLQISSTGTVRGKVFVHYKNDLSDLTQSDASEFRQDARSGCTNFREGFDSNICIAVYHREPNWRSIYQTLVALRIFDLPDESTLPDPEFEINDGVAIVVEVRHGSNYRTYEYSNPGSRNEPEAVAAKKIMGVVARVMRAAKGH